MGESGGKTCQTNPRLHEHVKKLEKKIKEFVEHMKWPLKKLGDSFKKICGWNDDCTGIVTLGNILCDILYLFLGFMELTFKVITHYVCQGCTFKVEGGGGGPL